METMIDRVVVAPHASGGHEVVIIGNLVGLLSFADKKSSGAYVASERSLKLVAGARNPRYQHSIEVEV